MNRLAWWTTACVVTGLICYFTPGGIDAGSIVAYWAGGVMMYWNFVRDKPTGGSK